MDIKDTADLDALEREAQTIGHRCGMSADTVLALVARVRELEDENAQLLYAIAGDADYVHPDSIMARKLVAEYERGRRDGLEEAVNVLRAASGSQYGDRGTAASHLANIVEHLIDAKEQAPQSPEGPAQTTPATSATGLPFASVPRARRDEGSCHASYCDGRDDLWCLRTAGHDGPHADYRGHWPTATPKAADGNLLAATMDELKRLRAIVAELAAFDPQDEDGGFCLFCAGCALSTEQPHAPSCPWRRAREATRVGT